MSNAFHQFKTGFMSILVGIQLIQRPRIRWLVVLPFAITLFLLMGGMIIGLPFLWTSIPFFVRQGLLTVGLIADAGYFIWVQWLTIILIWPAALFALLVMLLVLARMVATPLYALLAERVLIETNLLPDRPFRVREWLIISIRMLSVSMIKLVVFVLAAAVLLVASFIPGVGLVAAFGFLLMAAFDIVDLGFEALQMGLADRFRAFKFEFPAFAGLATALGLVFLIPGLNFILFPAAVAGSSEILRLSQTRRNRGEV